MEEPSRSHSDRRDPFALACRYLAGRERSVAQVAEYLERRGVGSGEIESTVERLLALRYLDDRRYAKLYVEHRSRRSPRSGSMLLRELRSKGISAEVAQAAVGAFLQEVSERQLAWRCIEKLGRGDPSWKERAARRLRARGFDPSLALQDWEDPEGSAEHDWEEDEDS